MTNLATAPDQGGRRDSARGKLLVPALLPAAQAAAHLPGGGQPPLLGSKAAPEYRGGLFAVVVYQVETK